MTETIEKDERYKKLQEPFPETAYKVDGSRGFDLTTIDAYHVIERLNEIFGMCGTGWKLVVKEWVTSDGEIVAISELWYDINTDKPKVVQCVGGKRIVKNNLTDAYKSAQTNAICKGASFIGVGIDVYKGEKGNGGKDTRQQKPPKKSSPRTPTETPTPPPFEPATPEQVKFIKTKILKSKYLFDHEQYWIQRLIDHKTLSKNIASQLIDNWINGERDRRKTIADEKESDLDMYAMTKLNEWGDKVGTEVIDEYNEWLIKKAEKEDAAKKEKK